MLSLENRKDIFQAMLNIEEKCQKKSFSLVILFLLVIRVPLEFENRKYHMEHLVY